MRTRLALAASLFGAALAACGGGDNTPPLSITPSGAVQVAGPMTFTASPKSLAGKVTWALTGPGSLSGSTGATVVYRPPAQVDPTQTATLTATAAGQSASAQLSLAAPQMAPGVIAGLHDKVSVLYDAQDIPHIFCTSSLDCFAAQGYLQAQDRFFQMDLFRRTARGKLSTMLGAKGVGSDQQFLTFFTTRDGKRIEDLLVANLDADTSAKLSAYASGVNAWLAFLAKNPAAMPGEYAQLPFPMTAADLPAWTLQDTLAIGRLQQFQLSETLSKESNYGQFAKVFAPGGSHADPGRFVTYVRARQPVAGYTLSPTDNVPAQGTPQTSAQAGDYGDLSRWQAGLAQVAARLDELQGLFGSLHRGAGSNNWVVDGAHSASGKALVANDPHLALQYPPLFHLAALVSSDAAGLNITGGAFPGIPGALVGRGAHVGWGVTVVGYDVTDIYLEQLTSCGAPAPVPCVLFNGAPVPTLPVPLKISVRTAAGLVDQNFVVLVVPHHGPVIAPPDTTAGTAISMRWTGHEVTNDLKAFLDLNNASAVGNATTAGTAFAALKNYAVGAQNFVLADDQGNIGYDPHALVPLRPWAGTVVNGRPLLPWLPLPGDGTAEWGPGGGVNCAGTGASAPTAACWVPDNQLPQAVNPTKGYLATANSDPAGYSDTTSATGLPTGVAGAPYLSFDWDDPTDVRYARIAQLLKAKTTGGAKVSLDDMKAIQSDHQSYLAGLFLPFAPPASAVPAAQQAAYGAALAILTQWKTNGLDCPTGLTSADPNSAPVTDATTLQSSAGCLLFHTFLRTLLQNVFADEFAFVGKGFSADGGAEVRGMLYLLSLPSAAPAAASNMCNDLDKNGNDTPHTCSDQYVKAVLTAFGTLNAAYGADPKNWIWGRVHTLTTASPAAPLIANGYGAGPYARPGGAFTVDVGSPDSSPTNPLSFSYGHGSNVRFIGVMDSGAPVIKMQLPGPERDAPQGVFSNVPDLIGQYVQNQYFDYLSGHQIDNAASSSQGFTAQ